MNHGGGKASRVRRRHGNVLVLFAILLFGIFAMATLVIDLGIVRVTQRQMQTAVDSAALEGLRFRDEALIADWNEPTDGGIDDIATDDRWRTKARDWVARVYSEDGDTPRQTNFGSTQTLEFSGGFGDQQMFASQDMRVNPQGYSPSQLHALQLNVGNDPDGDIYASFDGFWEIRLRRTGELPVADIRSSGPRLPFVFGRGTMLYRPGQLRQPIGDGIGVRATGVAQAVPAVAVGNADLPGSNWPRALNVAVSEGDWHVLDDGSLAKYRTSAMRLHFLGQAVTGEDSEMETPCDCEGVSFGYVGITSITSDGVERVIGFGLVTVDSAAEDGDSSDQQEKHSFRPIQQPDGGPAGIVGINASASVATAWGRLTTEQRDEIAPITAELIAFNRELQTSLDNIVLAPVSARQP